MWLDLSAVFFPEVGGATLDSHHGFVVEYGIDRDVDLGKGLLRVCFSFLVLRYDNNRFCELIYCECK